MSARSMATPSPTHSTRRYGAHEGLSIGGTGGTKVKGDSTWQRSASPLELLEALKKRTMAVAAPAVSDDPEINQMLHNAARPTAPLGLVASLDATLRHPTMKSSLTTHSVEALGASMAKARAQLNVHKTSSVEVLAAGSLVSASCRCGGTVVLQAPSQLCCTQLH